MKNSEKSIYPIERLENEKGLTKREYFAGLAMQGIVSNSKLIYYKSESCKIAIELADELLKQLEQK